MDAPHALCVAPVFTPKGRHLKAQGKRRLAAPPWDGEQINNVEP
jgi:hypothetical protein